MGDQYCSLSPILRHPALTRSIMNYHILHQFDEQWFADTTQDSATKRQRNFFGADEPHHKQSSLVRRALSNHRLWPIVIASLLLAACALYFALDARRHAAEVQQRLSSLETTIKK